MSYNYRYQAFYLRLCFQPVVCRLGLSTHDDDNDDDDDDVIKKYENGVHVAAVGQDD